MKKTMKKTLFLLLSLLCGPPLLFAQLPATTGWYHIPTSTIRSVSPADNFGGSGYSFQTFLHSHVDAWNSGIFDSRRNRLITFGGGHNDYSGNELYALDLNTLAISRIHGPALPPVTSGHSESIGSEANSRHTYASLAYIESIDKMFMYGGSLSADGNFSHATWLYDFKSASTPWQLMSPTGTVPGNSSPCCPMAVAYDPNTGNVFLQDNDGLYRYNVAANSYTKLSSTGTGYYVNGVVDPIAKRFYVIGATVSKFYDISSGSSFAQQNLATSGCTPVANNAPGLAFDPVAHKVVMWDDGNTIYALNGSTGACTSTTYASGPPARGAPAVGTFGRFAYSKKSGGFAEINSVDNDAYFLRTSAIPATTAVPDLWDEMKTYTLWGWTWPTNLEPNYANVSYSVSGPNIHADTEGDDLWTYLFQFRRTAQPGFIDRANAWASYYKNSYNQNPLSCISDGINLCYDENNYGADHMVGWGLIDYYNYTGDASYLTAAINLGVTLETMYGPSTPFGCMFTNGCLQYGVRQIGRHLRFSSLLAEATGDPRWATLRDRIITLLLTSPYWNATYGIYYEQGDAGTGATCGTGCYLASPFQIGILVEGMAQAFRTTGNTTLRDRIVAMANFANTYALDPTYQYTGSVFGIVNGLGYNNYFATCGGSCTFTDPAMTTALVNTLVWGYKFSGNAALLAKAKVHFNRGTKARYGSIARTSADNVVDHFVDTIFDSSTGNFYLAFNKGELQYTYLLFENGGAPTVLNTGPVPTAPTNVHKIGN